MHDPESWLTSVVSRAAALANEMAQLTDCLAAHNGTDRSHTIDTYADALTARLRQLETAADRLG